MSKEYKIFIALFVVLLIAAAGLGLFLYFYKSSECFYEVADDRGSVVSISCGFKNEDIDHGLERYIGKVKKASLRSNVAYIDIDFGNTSQRLRMGEKGGRFYIRNADDPVDKEPEQLTINKDLINRINNEQGSFIEISLYSNKGLERAIQGLKDYLNDPDVVDDKMRSDADKYLDYYNNCSGEIIESVQELRLNESQNLADKLKGPMVFNDNDCVLRIIEITLL